MTQRLQLVAELSFFSPKKNSLKRLALAQGARYLNWNFLDKIFSIANMVHGDSNQVPSACPHSNSTILNHWAIAWYSLVFARIDPKSWLCSYLYHLQIQLKSAPNYTSSLRNPEKIKNRLTGETAENKSRNFSIGWQI